MKSEPTNQQEAAAKEIRLLSPYVVGTALRRWYLRKLIAHHMHSAHSELESANQHYETAAYFLHLANASRVELDRMGDK